MADESLTKQFGLDADAQRDTGGLSSYLQNLRDDPTIAANAKGIHDQLHPKQGGRYLEVGCGAGDDACALAARVAPGGSVVGIDVSDALIREAQAKGASAGVEFATGDAHELNYADGDFDGASAYRVFMHLRAPEVALRELVRVTKPGGRIAIREPDWHTVVIDGPGGRADQSVQDYIRRNFVRHSGIAHHLPNLFKRVGLRDLHIAGAAFPMTSIDFGAKVLDLENKVREAVTEEVVTEGEGAEWLGFLERQSSDGTFFASLTSFLVAGTVKP